jgi:hypothetical protein
MFRTPQYRLAPPPQETFSKETNSPELLNSDMVLLLSLDCDDMLVIEKRDTHGNTYYEFSPKVYDYIEQTKKEAKEAGAEVAGFVLNTARGFQTELRCVLDGAVVPIHWIKDKLMELIKLPCLGVATSDDAAVGKKFGESYALSEKFLRAVFQKDPSCYQVDDNKQVVIKLPDAIKRANFVERVTQTKNPQHRQAASMLHAKYPNKKKVIRHLDDNIHITKSAISMSKMELPPQTALEFYDHVASAQTKIIFIGSVCNFKQVPPAPQRVLQQRVVLPPVGNQELKQEAPEKREFVVSKNWGNKPVAGAVAASYEKNSVAIFEQQQRVLRLRQPAGAVVQRRVFGRG